MRGVERRLAPALRRGLLGLLILLGILLLPALDRRQPETAPASWRPAFVAALHAPLDVIGPPYDDRSLRFDDVSLRQFVPLELPGRTVRIRLSNQFGDGPLEIGAAQLAWRSAARGAAIDAATSREVTFDGRTTVSIDKGQTLTSDPVQMPEIARRADLAVSLYLPRPTPRASWHLVGSRSSHRSPPGNHLGSSVLPQSAQAPQDRSLYFLAGVEVLDAQDAALWVAFGDSITDGNGHSLDMDASWPAQVSERWRTTRSGARVAMLNAGISGNRLLSDEVDPSGRKRFDRDVLALEGLRGVVMLIGINDLAGTTQREAMAATVQRLIDAQTDLASRARARGLKVVGATLTPSQGGVYGRNEVDAARQQFNRWVRTTEVFDAVVDLDAALRDPSAPQRIRSELTRDGLHPNDAGYRVIADSVVRMLGDAGLQR